MRARFLAFLLTATFFSAQGASSELRIEGATMGTRYSVRVAESRSPQTEPQLQGTVAVVLERVDALMSTYRPDSELERFNRQPGTQWVSVSPETARVAGAARDLAERSQGAFDPTVGPLVKLWGFGSESPVQVPPAASRLEAARAAVGFRHYHVREEPPALRKDHTALELDLSAIAKGYAVDAVASRLVETGLENFLVEIGGEIRVSGVSARGDAWIIEIEDPSPHAAEPTALVRLRNAAIATSGPYRNFVVREGVRLPHVLDPRSGAPVATDLISVSVIASSAMEADGWATALLVAGPEAGWEMARRHDLAALFMSHRDGQASRRATRSFVAHSTDRGAAEHSQP